MYPREQSRDSTVETKVINCVTKFPTWGPIERESGGDPLHQYMRKNCAQWCILCWILHWGGVLMVSQVIYCKNQLIYRRWYAQHFANLDLSRSECIKFCWVSLLLYHLKSHCKIPVDHSKNYFPWSLFQFLTPGFYLELLLWLLFLVDCKLYNANK